MGMWLLNHEFAAKVGWLKWDLLIKRNAMSIINYLYRVLCSKTLLDWHDDVIKWKHFSHCWPFVRGIPRSPVNSPHKGQWRRALMFSLICVWVNNYKAGDLRRYRAHYDVSVMGPHIIWRILTHVHSPGLLGWYLLKCNSDNMFQLYQWNWRNHFIDHFNNENPFRRARHYEVTLHGTGGFVERETATP